MGESDIYTIGVSVIFVNYNSTDMLIESIRSVKRHTYHASYELIVVDNASPDNGIHRIREIFQDEVRIIESSKNLGFGGANNLGIQIAKGEYLFFLNPDTLLLNEAIDIFYAYCERHKMKRIGALGTLLLSREQKIINSYGAFISPCSIILKRLGIHKSFPKQSEVFPIQVDFITGADLFVPRKVIEEIGNFDTNFFMYCEEVDLQQRMAQKSYQRMIINEAKIIHYDGGSYEQVLKRSASRRKEQDKSICKYIKKYYSPMKYWLFLFFFIIIRFPAYINPHYSMKENWDYLKMLILHK